MATSLPVLDLLAPSAPTSKPLVLSKSRFMAGLQCAKRLHLEINAPELQDVLEESDEAILESGYEMGDMGRRLYPSGRLVDDDPTHFDKAHAQTIAAMADADVPAIFEAAFEYQGARVRVDALVRVGEDEYDLVEIKSSGGPKPEHTVDAALQLHVLRGAGVNVRGVQLVHPNTDYVRPPGDLDPHDFFTAVDLTDASEAMIPQVIANLHELAKIVKRPDAPAIPTGSHCKKPVTCPFWGHCHKNLSLHPVGELPFISQKLRGLLAEARIDDIRDIPPEFKGLSDNQARIRDVVVTGVPHRNEDGLAEAFKAYKYPVHFLDFETIQPGIPLYPGTRAYQTIPVQWSNHTLMNTKGRTYHKEFLHGDDTDPRPRFLKSLIKALKGDGTIVVYSSFEEKRLLELAQSFPEYAADLHAIVARFSDLLAIMRKHVYYPGFHGSFSIKKVLPVLVPGLSYRGLMIANGAVAAAAYMEILRPTTTTERRMELSTALLAYCRLDTEAMLKLYLKLDQRMQVQQTPSPLKPRRTNGTGRRTMKDVAPTPAQLATITATAAVAAKRSGLAKTAGPKTRTAVPVPAPSPALTRQQRVLDAAEAVVEAAAPAVERSTPAAGSGARRTRRR
jgi:hypothetical protein